jgi:hypothetical protein
LKITARPAPFLQRAVMHFQRPLHGGERRAQFLPRAATAQIRVHYFLNVVLRERGFSGLAGAPGGCDGLSVPGFRLVQRRRFFQFLAALGEPHVAQIVKRLWLHGFILPGERGLKNRLGIGQVSRR